MVSGHLGNVTKCVLQPCVHGDLPTDSGTGNRSSRQSLSTALSSQTPRMVLVRYLSTKHAPTTSRTPLMALTNSPGRRRASSTPVWATQPIWSLSRECPCSRKVLVPSQLPQVTLLSSWLSHPSWDQARTSSLQ